MNDAMYLVDKRWYILYWTEMMLFSLAIILGYAASRIFHLDQLGSWLGLTTTACVIAGMHVFYSLTLYWIVAKKNQPLAVIIGAMFFTAVVFNGLSLTGDSMGGWVYVGLWLALLLFVGMFGLPLALGSVLLSFLYIFLESDFRFGNITWQAWGLAIGSLIVAPSCFLFWRKKFINPQEAELNQLSGKLRTNQEQSAILIQSIADGVIVTDTTGKVSLINRAASNMTGWTVDEATGVDIRAVLKVAKEKGEPIPEQEYPFTAVLVHKAFINQVLQVTSRDGKKKQVVSLVISPVVTATGEVYGAVAVIRDISEQRAAEQQRAEFISTASHEMRTPVAAIEGYLSLALNDKVSTIDSRARGFLSKAHASTEHLGKLFQDLLTSAKAEDGRLSSHPQVIEMGSYLEQLVEDLRFTAQKKNLLTEFIVGTTSGGTIDATSDGKSSLKVVKPLYYTYADPERIREVITNLFDNAIKYTDQGKISMGLTGDGDVVQFYIKDSGQGIPAEDIPHLFQKFYRVDNSATRVIGGTGLGLFICRKIVELYNGRIWVESEIGKGSTFFINLPRITAQKAAALQAQEPTATTTPQTPGTAMGKS